MVNEVNDVFYIWDKSKPQKESDIMGREKVSISAFLQIQLRFSNQEDSNIQDFKFGE